MTPKTIQKRDEFFRLCVDKIPEVKKVIQTAGDRTEEHEKEIYDNHDNINAGADRPTFSAHVGGVGFDCVWEDEHGKLRHPGPKMGALAESIGLRWGGRFEHPDSVHFDLGLEAIAAAHAVRLGCDVQEIRKAMKLV